MNSNIFGCQRGKTETINTKAQGHEHQPNGNNVNDDEKTGLTQITTRLIPAKNAFVIGPNGICKCSKNMSIAF